MIRTRSDRRKYYANYLAIAITVYKKLFRTTLPSSKSKYVEVVYDDKEPFPFVWKPDDMQRFYGISVPNKHGRLVQSIYDENLNVYTKPANKKPCGCTTSELSDCIDNMQVIITPKVIDGVTYSEKAWVKCCPNGDVLQYREVPVKSYGTEGGSYSNDYGDDYDIINEGSNVVTLKFTENLGKLDTMPCGCPIESDNNKKLVYDCCGCYLPCKTFNCKKWYEKNPGCLGSYKWSECGDKLYLHKVRADNGYVVLSYQPNSLTPGEEVVVPDYSLDAIIAGINFESIRYFPRAGLGEKQMAKANYDSEETKLFEYLNPLTERVFNIVTAELKL
jgi:hypothetical protein